jgi:hypothetical protein
VGPIAAWVPERRASTEAANSSMKQKVILNRQRLSPQHLYALTITRDNQ